MKKITLTLMTFAMLFLLMQCSNPSPEKLCTDAVTRGRIISCLMNNDGYMNEVMDSMRTKHPDVILSTVFVIAKEDKQMQENMVDNMMGMCKADSSMCKTMMAKTMDMCDSDSGKCSMMMAAMNEHPKGMQAMKDMGMCDMKGMNMEQKGKTIHSITNK
jgi:hypothetical protein